MAGSPLLARMSTSRRPVRGVLAQAPSSRTHDRAAIFTVAFMGHLGVRRQCRWRRRGYTINHLIRCTCQSSCARFRATVNLPEKSMPPAPHPPQLTRDFLQFKTVNPPGAERDCARGLGKLLGDGGLSVRYHEISETRTSLVAPLW